MFAQDAQRTRAMRFPRRGHSTPEELRTNQSAEALGEHSQRAMGGCGLAATSGVRAYALLLAVRSTLASTRTPRHVIACVLCPLSCCTFPDKPLTNCGSHSSGNYYRMVHGWFEKLSQRGSWSEPRRTVLSTDYCGAVART